MTFLSSPYQFSIWFGFSAAYRLYRVLWILWRAQGKIFGSAVEKLKEVMSSLLFSLFVETRIKKKTSKCTWHHLVCCLILKQLWNWNFHLRNDSDLWYQTRNCWGVVMCTFPYDSRNHWFVLNFSVNWWGENPRLGICRQSHHRRTHSRSHSEYLLQNMGTTNRVCVI